METDSHEYEVEDLLRQVFDEARRDGARDLSGVRAAALTRAARLRRRQRRLATLTSAGGGLVAAALVAVVVLPGLSRTSDKDPRPATSATTATATATATTAPSTAKAAQRDWGAYLDNGQPFSYTIPEAQPNPLPEGLAPFGQPPEASASGAVAPAGLLSDADLAGVAGYCRWEEEPDRRQPVAGRSWQYQLSSQPGGYAAGLGIAGFTTGTGPDALQELRNWILPCGAPGLQPVAWPGEDRLAAVLMTRTATELDVTWTTTLALRRVGDLVVAGSAKSRSKSDATRIATQLAIRAAERLEQMGFPPALGQPLGASAEAPNEASRPGAEAATPLEEPAAYAFGDVFPTASELPAGMRYHGDPTLSRDMAPVMGSQICDSEAVASNGTGQEKGPRPVAGTYVSAWAGGGGFSDPSVDLALTGWSTGTGAARFSDLQKDRLFCAWMPAQRREAWAGRDASQTWLSRGTSGLTEYTAAQRVGDVIVSAVVRAPSAADARRWAIELSDQVAEKVRASGLPAAQGR